MPSVKQNVNGFISATGPITAHQGNAVSHRVQLSSADVSPGSLPPDVHNGALKQQQLTVPTLAGLSA